MAVIGAIPSQDKVTPVNETRGYAVGGPITPRGQLMINMITSSNVKHLWLAHQRIIWDTGEADLTDSRRTSSTHCSAYVAAIATRLHIPILHPPEHPQTLLANAQARWLAGPCGQAAGWQAVTDDAQAQTLANQGELVVAVWQNTPDVGNYGTNKTNKPGHIVIIRPDTVSASWLAAHGPSSAQAGEYNSAHTNILTGFKAHAGAWLPGGGGTIRYYVHKVDWTACSANVDGVATTSMSSPSPIKRGHVTV